MSSTYADWIPILLTDDKCHRKRNLYSTGDRQCHEQYQIRKLKLQLEENIGE